MIWAFPAAAGAIAVAFAVRCAASASAPMRFWAAALAQYAVAATALAAGVGIGWSPGLYRVYFLFGAVLNVAWLGLGTLWLLTPRAVALVATAVVAAASLAGAAATVVSPLRASSLASALPVAAATLGPAPRAFATSMSIAGSVVVLGGLVWSVVGRRRPAGGMAALAAGVAVVVASSRFARAGRVTPFSVGLAVGVSAMYAGFVIASRRPGGTDASARGPSAP